MALSKKVAEAIAADINSLVVARDMLTEESIANYLANPTRTLDRAKYVSLWLGYQREAATRLKANGIPVKYL